MPRLFSRRNKPRTDQLRFDVPETVRRRIVVWLFQQETMWGGGGGILIPMLDQLNSLLRQEYGGLLEPADRSQRTNDPAVIQHFALCDDTMALDFVEACFHTFYNPGQRGIDAFNQIFEDEGVGYFLTPYVETYTETAADAEGRVGRTVEIQRPEIIRKDSEFIHAEAVIPALSLLSDHRYKGANEEFLQAHKHYRDGDHKACLNECLKTFESVMKIICDAKKWANDPSWTAKPLIKTCLDNGLLPTFNEQQLNGMRMFLESAIPTTRNKLGGHGQGSQQHDVSPELARYALHITAATVLLLVESAKI